MKISHLRRKPLGLKRQASKDTDKKLSKVEQEWERGGRASYMQDSKKLADFQKALESGEAATGGLVGMIPKDVRLLYSNIAPEWAGSKEVAAGVSAELDVMSIVKKSMREILGGQFAEREGRELVKTMFNPGLPKETLAKNINEIKLRLDRAAKAKDSGLSLQELERAYFGTTPGYSRDAQESPNKEAPKVRTKEQEFVTLKGPDGSIKNIKSDKADKYLSKEGYSIVK